MEYVVTCKCKDIALDAHNAYKILFGQEPPEVYSGRDAIYKLAEHNSGTNFATYLRALAQTTGKFMFYFKIASNGDVLEQWNLQTGKRVA